MFGVRIGGVGLTNLLLCLNQVTYKTCSRTCTDVDVLNFEWWGKYQNYAEFSVHNHDAWSHFRFNCMESILNNNSRQVGKLR